MAKYYAPNFSGLLPLFDGKSAAGGKLYAYRAGSSIPAPLFNEDGVELGSWVSIDSNGCADFLLDSALSYKLVVKDALGAVVGEWDNVKASNAPGGMDNPMTAPGDLIVGGTGGTATALPAGNNDQMLSPYTEGGVKKLKWKDIPAQPGDHKVMVDGADSTPGYLLDKLTDGDNAHFSKSGNAVRLDTDNDKVAANNTDTAPGYLLDKLYPGDGIAIEAFLDGAVRKVKVSATGGGGGGGVDEFVKWTQEFVGATGTTAMSNTQSIVLKCYADTDMTPEEVVLPCDHQYANTTYKAFIVVGTETFSSSTVSFSGSVSIITPATTPPRVAHIPLTGKNGFTKIEEGKTYFLVFGKSVGSTSEYFKQDYGVTLYHARTYAGAITETPNWAWNNASAQTGLPIVGLKFKRV